jgi:hypothetical protein
MFCNSCQSFWSETLAQAKIPETIKKPRDIVWTLSESNLHTGLYGNSIRHQSIVAIRVDSSLTRQRNMSSLRYCEIKTKLYVLS